VFIVYIRIMNVIIADSNDLVRIGLRTVMSSDRRINIVGEARSSEELKSQLKNFETDVVIIDYTAPGFSIEVIPQILSKNKHVRFVAVTPEQSAVTIVEALRSGVVSYVKKDCDISEIMSSVNETYAGNKFFCGQILETIQKASIDVEDIDFDSFSCEPITLSERELEIITLIAEGHTNGQIGEILHLSTHTITTHRKNIMAKLGVKNTAAIVMYAVKTNLVSPNKFLFAGEAN
jgi:DNA-binding NarL/FixJ family response regulator